jgi:hypothetical protein
VAVAAQPAVATTKPTSPSPAPVQAPTRTAVRTRRPNATGSKTLVGVGSSMTIVVLTGATGTVSGAG